MACEASKECWRYSYSKYYKEVGYGLEIPTRDLLFLAGYVPVEIMPRGGIFAESLPYAGHESGLCPDLLGRGSSQCTEYKKWQSKHRRREKSASRYPDRQPRRYLSPELKREIAARARYKCEYCGRAHNTICSDGRKLRCVVDHFVPLALGGDPLAPENLLFSCVQCNSDKGVEIWRRGCRIIR